MHIRLATLDDISQIERLIEMSARELAVGDYSKEQIELALTAAWGLDTQLILDETYIVIESEEEIAACGGWSFREALYGNDAEANRDLKVVDAEQGAAKIRAFFVHPGYARKGLGTLMLDHCEKAAKKKGYNRLELMATLPGKRLYERHGYLAGTPGEYPLNERLTITFVPMKKALC